MGEELVETLQVFFDAGGNRREAARRLHLADRTIAYRPRTGRGTTRPRARGRGGPPTQRRPDAAKSSCGRSPRRDRAGMTRARAGVGSGGGGLEPTSKRPGQDPSPANFDPSDGRGPDSTGQRVTKVIAPSNTPSFHAIPIRVDFVAGSGLTLAVIVVTTRRPWRPGLLETWSGSLRGEPKAGLPWSAFGFSQSTPPGSQRRDLSTASVPTSHSKSS